MRILDRYIQKNIFTIFLSSVFIFCLLYLLIDVTAQLDEFIDRKVPISVLLKYYLYFFPVILTQTASMSCLIAVLLTFSGLTNNNELIAMRSSGLNFWKITRPALFFGLIISTFVFLINEKIIPPTSQVTKQIRNENMVLEADRYRKHKEKVKNLTFYGLKNRLYFIDTFDPDTNELQGVNIIEYDNNQGISQKIIAFKGKWT